MSEGEIVTSTPVVQVHHQYTIVSEKGDTVAQAMVVHRNGVHWVSNVWTDNEFRGKGYATSILNDIIREWGIDRDLYLHVAPYTDRPISEEGLARWYEKLGFRKVEGSPGIMMRPANRQQDLLNFVALSEFVRRFENKIPFRISYDIDYGVYDKTGYTISVNGISPLFKDQFKPTLQEALKVASDMYDRMLDEEFK